MDRLEHKIYRKITRRRRIRAKIYGTTARPRLTVFISNRQISAQIINDEKQSTIAAVTTITNKTLPANLTKKAAWVGGEIAKKARIELENKTGKKVITTDNYLPPAKNTKKLEDE